MIDQADARDEVRHPGARRPGLHGGHRRRQVQLWVTHALDQAGRGGRPRAAQGGRDRSRSAARRTASSSPTARRGSRRRLDERLASRAGLVDRRGAVAGARRSRVRGVGLPHLRHRQHAPRGGHRRHLRKHDVQGDVLPRQREDHRAATPRSTRRGPATGSSGLPKATPSAATPGATAASAPTRPTARSGTGRRSGRTQGRTLTLSSQDFCAELKRPDAAFRDMHRPPLDALWRAPGGRTTPGALKTAQALRLRARAAGRRPASSATSCPRTRTRTTRCWPRRCATCATATS